jgi:hypothetical protein
MYQCAFVAGIDVVGSDVDHTLSAESERVGAIHGATFIPEQQNDCANAERTADQHASQGLHQPTAPGLLRGGTERIPAHIPPSKKCFHRTWLMRGRTQVLL